MKLGLLVESEEGLDWEHWRTTYHAAERLGFESVWISDHLTSPWDPERHGLEPWVALAVAAAETRRVRLGPLVSPITFREPAIVARMSQALQGLSAGRFVLGLGLGWNAQEHARFGVAFPSSAERGRRLRAGIELIRQMLGSEPLPLLIGGGGQTSTLPIVARYADEWNLTTASLEVYQARSAELKALCQEVGRDPRMIRRSVAAGCLVGRNEAEIRERGRRLQGKVPPLAEALQRLRHPDDTRQTGGVVGQPRLDDVCQAARQLGWVAGTSREIIDALRPLSAAGVDLAILGHYDLDDVDALELIASDIMPALA